MSFWVKLNDLNSNNTIIARHNNSSNIFALNYEVATSSFHFMTRDDDGSNYHNYYDFKPNQGQWYHITMQRERGVAKRLYVDGVLEYEIEDPNSWLTFPDLRIGANEQNFSSADMYFDDLQLWNIALTKDQIFSYMVNSPSGDENNIVGYYNFDEIINGNQLHDLSNSSNNGIIYGASLNGDIPPEIIPGCTDIYAENYNPDANYDDGSCSGYPNQENYAVSFDGEGAHINMGSESLLDLDGKSFSMDLWFKMADTNEEQIVLTKWNEHYVGESVSIFTRGNSQIGFAFVYDDLMANINLNNNEWYYVCATFDANSRERKLYINGQLAASDISSTVLINSDDGDWLIGKRAYPNQPLNFAGNVDNVGIFSSILSPQEIEDRYNLNYSPNAENILANWKFNSGSGSFVFDHSGNLNHGEIFGATWSEDVAPDPEYLINTIAQSVNGVTGTYAADIDGDGDLDAVSSSYDDSRILWHENNGGDLFVEHVVSTNGSSPRSVHTADVDGDGDMDIISASFIGDKISWHNNDGNQNFSEEIISTNTNGATFVRAVDIDQDGDVDILSTSLYDNKLSLFKNDGSQNFSQINISESAEGPRHLHVDDIDQNGTLDVLTAGVYDNRNKVLLFFRILMALGVS